MYLFGLDAVNCTAHYLQKMTSAKHSVLMLYCASIVESSTKLAHDNDTFRPVDGNIIISIIKHFTYYLSFNRNSQEDVQKRKVHKSFVVVLVNYIFKIIP
jgi:hypothetical protein